MQPTSTSTKGLPSKFPNNKLSRFEGIWATCMLLNLALCRRNLWLLSKVVHQRFAIGRITKIKAQPECCILVSMFDLMKSHKHQLASLCSMYKCTVPTSLDNSPLSFALTRLLCACVFFVFENKTKCDKNVCSSFQFLSYSCIENLLNTIWHLTFWLMHPSGLGPSHVFQLSNIFNHTN